MIETLYNLLGNVPVVGESLASAYLANRIKNAIQKTKDRKLDAQTADMAGDKVDNYCQDQANAIFDEEVGPVIREKNIPELVVNPLKEKAIEELSGILKDKLVQKMTTSDTK